MICKFPTEFQTLRRNQTTASKSSRKASKKHAICEKCGVKINVEGHLLEVSLVTTVVHDNEEGDGGQVQDTLPNQDPIKIKNCEATCS